MAFKDTFWGTLLTSALISGIISTGFNYYGLSVKDRAAQQVNFATMVNTVIVDRAKRGEVCDLVFASLVLEPMYRPRGTRLIPFLQRDVSDYEYRLYGVVQRLIEDTSTAPTEEVDRCLTQNTDNLTSPALTAALENDNSIPSEYSITELRDGFFSGFRRQLSDELVRKIDNGETDLSGRLIDAIIQPEEDPTRRYRVNLYVAYTLARVVSWTAQDDKITTFKELMDAKEYLNDPTFKKHVDEALQRIRQPDDADN